jgi:hypothetical protein
VAAAHNKSLRRTSSMTLPTLGRKMKREPALNRKPLRVDQR